MTQVSSHIDEIPLIVTIATEKKNRGIVTIFDEVAAMKAIKVPRDKISGIPDDWKMGCGFYILVSDINAGSYHAYVGKATQNNFHARISSHRREKDNWSYAFLFQRDTTNGLNSTQASYVEGVIFRAFQEHQQVEVINNQTAGDKTLTDHEVFYMNQVVKSALRILNIFGYEIETYEECAVHSEHSHHNHAHGDKDSSEKQSTTYYGVSIEELIRSGLLKAGEPAVSLSKKYPGNGSVGEKGMVADGKELAPSRAALVIQQQHSPEMTNSASGWTFWGVNRSGVWISLSELRDHYLNNKKIYAESLLTEKDIDFDESIQANENNRQEYLNSLDTDEKTETIPEEVLIVEETLDPDRHLNARLTINDLLESGHLEEGTPLIVLEEPYFLDEVEVLHGGIRFRGNVYPSPHIASKYAKRIVEPTAAASNGWNFWGVKKYDGTTVSLSEVLDDYLEH